MKRYRTTAWLLLFLVMGSPLTASPSINWIVNGDFKAQEGWKPAPVTQAGREGKTAASLESTELTWNALEQDVKLPQPLPPAIEVSGWMKTEGVSVAGMHDWEMARITVTFYDEKGIRAGDWPADIARLKGTHDWDFYSNQYSVPQGASYARIGLVLDHCTGKAWYSGIQCLVYDYDLKPLTAGKPTHPDLKAPLEIKGDNWIMNPGFEMPGSNDWGQCHITGNGHQSAHCDVAQNDVPSWNLAGQLVSFQGKTPAYVVYSGWVKPQGVVRGKEQWEAARLGIDFRDDQNKQVGGWQDSVCKVVGDTDWTYYERKYPLPPGATQAWLDAGLGNCTGKAWFDDLSLTLLDSDGKKIAASLKTEQTTDTSDWYAYQPPAKASDAAIDFSYLNEKPAGTHGFVSVKKGHFAFVDGTRVRFWGTDGVGPNLFIGHEEADLVAARMAKLGFNLVRMHFLDNNWGDVSLFDPKADNTQTFNPESLDKMDYLIAALKKNGIYVYPDWSVGRKFRKGDNVEGSSDLEDGSKTVIHFSRRVIELNKKYAEMLLTHVNPYTKIALKDDPVYVGNEIVNESSIFCGFGEQNFPQPFWDELQKIFEAWGGKGPISHFKFDWDTQKLVPTQNPENADVSLKFLLETVMKSNLEMKAFLKKISSHALLTGSNMGLPVLGNVKSDSIMDFMDTHAYWDHPQIWNIAGGWQNVDHAPMNNNSQLKNPLQGSLLFNLSHAAVQGMPLIVTEWNDCVPNEYRIEGPVLMASYASLQDWDGMLQFDYGPSLIGAQKMTNFAINSRPDNEPLNQVGALIFRQGLLKPSDVIVQESVMDKDILANGSKSSWLFDYPWLPYVAKVAKTFTGSKEVVASDLAQVEKLYDAQAKVIQSTTGEQTLDYSKGILKLDSPFVQGFTGAIGTSEVFNTQGFSVNAAKRNPWASVLAVSLDRKPLAESSKILLVAVARAENSGQVYNPTRTSLKDAGHTPILMQGVQADISLTASGKDYSVTPLDALGIEGKKLDARTAKGTLKFSISPKEKTSYYLITAKGNSKF